MNARPRAGVNLNPYQIDELEMIAPDRRAANIIRKIMSLGETVVIISDGTNRKEHKLKQWIRRNKGNAQIMPLEYLIGYRGNVNE